MAQAKITVNGTPGSNNNLPINTLVQLNNQNAGGETTYTWTILDQPAGATDSLSASNIQNPTFTPKKEGTYLLQLIVNQFQTTESRDLRIVGIRQLKVPAMRIPAAGETNQDDANLGWATAVDAALRQTESGASDGNIVVGVAAAAGLVRGTVLKAVGTATIKSTLPGEEKVPSFNKALATSAADMGLPLFVLEGGVDGSSTPANGALIRARNVGHYLAATGAGAISGSPVYVSDTGSLTLSPGTNTRVVGSVTGPHAGTFDLIFDGAQPQALASPVPTFNLGELFVHTYASGGDGSSGNPWTGWEATLNAQVAPFSAYFTVGYFRLSTGIVLNSGAYGSKLHGLHHGLSKVVSSSSFTGTAFTFAGPVNGATVGALAIEDLSIINGNLTTATHSVGMLVLGLQKVRTARCLFKDWARGLVLDQAENSDFIDCRFEVTKAWTGGNMVTGQVVTNPGIPGSTRYDYALVSVTAAGLKSDITTASTFTGNASLSLSGFNHIAWSAVAGADHYEVYRYTGGTRGLLGTTTNLNFDDIGQGVAVQYVPWKSAGIWILNGNDFTATAIAGFTNVINIERPHFNMVPGCLGIIDDGGDSHNYVAPDFNGGDKGIAMANIVTGHVLGGYFESQSSFCIQFNYQAFDVARDVGQSTSIHIANVEFSDNTHPAVHCFSISTVNIEDSTFLGTPSAGHITGVVNTANLRLASNYFNPGTKLTDSGLRYVDAKNFGASGEGNFDDSVAVQNAINALSSFYGGTVYFPPGTYLLNTGLVLPYDKITLEGSGPGDTTLKAGPSLSGVASAVYSQSLGDSPVFPYKMVSMATKTKCRITGLTFDANKANQTPILGLSTPTSVVAMAAIVLDTTGGTGCSDIIVDRCRFVDFYHAVVAPADGSSKTRIRIEDNDVVGGYIAFRIAGATECSISRNRVSGAFIGAVQVFVCKSCKVEDNDIRDSGFGYAAVWTASTSDPKGKVVFPSNMAAPPRGNMWVATVGGTSGGSEPSWASSPQSDGSVTWVIIPNDPVINLAQTIECSVSRNRIKYSWGDGINLNNASCWNVIASNHVIGVGWTLDGTKGNDYENGSPSGDAIALTRFGGGCCNNIVNGNVIVEPAGYGINVHPTCTNNVLSNNQIIETHDPGIECIGNYTSITGNTFRGCDGACIVVGPDDDGDDITTEHVSITGNTAYSNDLSFVYVNGAQHVTITGNSVYQCGMNAESAANPGAGDSPKKRSAVYIKRYTYSLTPFTVHDPKYITVTGNVFAGAGRPDLWVSTPGIYSPSQVPAAMFTLPPDPAAGTASFVRNSGSPSRTYAWVGPPNSNSVAQPTHFASVGQELNNWRYLGDADGYGIYAANETGCVFLSNIITDSGGSNIIQASAGSDRPLISGYTLADLLAGFNVTP